MTCQMIFDMDDVELGYYFYQQREKKGYSIRELHQISKVSINFITQFENGKQPSASLTNVRRLTKALGLELKYCLLK